MDTDEHGFMNWNRRGLTVRWAQREKRRAAFERTYGKLRADRTRDEQLVQHAVVQASAIGCVEPKIPTEGNEGNEEMRKEQNEQREA
jgi:hypothetical protein